jgi:hypothetical protein
MCVRAYGHRVSVVDVRVFCACARGERLLGLKITSSGVGFLLLLLFLNVDHEQELKNYGGDGAGELGGGCAAEGGELACARGTRHSTPPPLPSTPLHFFTPKKNSYNKSPGHRRGAHMALARAQTGPR